MCVIIIGDRTNKPTADDLEACWRRNPHGAGASWYGPDGRVHWHKGITELDQVVSMVDGFSGTWVMHFRYITVGGGGSILTHPFPISKQAPGDLVGAGNASVLFHNGTWRDWRDSSLNLALSHADAVIPDGDLSDSRMIAWIAAHKGYRFLRLLPGRFAVVTPNRGVRIFPEDRSGGWNEHHGVWYSNTDWQRLSARDGSGGGRVSWYHKAGLDDDARYSLPLQGGRAMETAPLFNEVEPMRRSKSGKRRGPTTSPQPNNPRRLGQRR